MNLKIILAIAGAAVIAISISVYIFVSTPEKKMVPSEADKAATTGKFEKVEEPPIPTFTRK